MTTTADKVLDTKGLNCPMPIIKAKQAIDELETDQILKILATDPGSIADFNGWTKQTGHKLIKSDEKTEDGRTVYQFFIQHK